MYLFSYKPVPIYIYLFSGEHFRGEQYMDGTPYITQCPIMPHNK